MYNNVGFQKKLTLSFTIIAILSMGVSGFVSYHFVSDIVQRLALDGLKKELASVEGAVEISSRDNLNRIAELMNFWGPEITSKLSVKPSADPEFLFEGENIKSHHMVDRLSREISGVVTVFAKTEKGFVRVSTSVKDEAGSRAVGTVLSFDSEQGKKLIEGSEYVGHSKILGSSYFVAYQPIKKNGQIVGAFFLGVKDNSQSSMKNFLKSQKLLETGYFYIMDSSGKFVMHPALEGKNVLNDTDLDGQPIFRKIIEQKNGSIEYRWLHKETQKPQDKIAIFQYFPEQDWYVAASLNKAEVLASTIELRWTLTIIAVGMTILMVLTTLIFGRSVAKRLGAVSKTLAESSEQVDKSGTELLTVSERLAQASLQQAASLQQTVAAIDEINAMVQRNLDGTQSVEQLSDQMSTAANLGQQILTELRDAITKISSKNHDLGEQMNESHQEMGKILQVIAEIEGRTKVINDIVFQTKLLSFNASVEAARAGEAGKGFSVVAEEVGRLAQMSGGAATEIQKNLEESRKQVEEIISKAQQKMHRLTSEADTEIKQGVEVSTRCQDVFEGLIGQIEEAHTSIQGISQASKEQSLGIGEISKAAGELDKVTQENSSAAQKVKELADVLGADSSRLDSSVGQLQNFLDGKGRKAA